MRRIEISDCTIGIRLGYRQENDWDVVVYRYPKDWTGEVQIYYKPPREFQSYPVSGFSQDYDAHTVTWTASAADLAKSGKGHLEYMMLDNGVVAKSKVFDVLVASDIISASTDAPEQWQSWVDTLAALGAVVTEAAHEAAVYVLCKVAKIPVRYCIGWTDDGLHAYNRVKVGGKWYWMDSDYDEYLTRSLWDYCEKPMEVW